MPSWKNRRRLLTLGCVPLVISLGAVFAAHGASAGDKPHTAPARLAPKAQTTTSGYVEVCKSSANGMSGKSFLFAINESKYVTVKGGGCSAPIPEKVGLDVTVTEQANNYGAVTSGITVSPADAKVSKNVSEQTITVKVLAAGQANEDVVTFTNKIAPGQLKICKQADPSSGTLVGDAFSFTENNGPAFSVDAGSYGNPNCSSLSADYPAGTTINVAELPTAGVHASAIQLAGAGSLSGTSLSGGSTTVTLGSGVSVLTYTNATDPVAQGGYIEVCKQASDADVHGWFNFTITDSSGATQLASVLTGQCSGSIPVASGNVSVAEQEVSPYYLDQVYTYPSNDLNSVTNTTANVTVAASSSTANETQVTFENNTTFEELKVCKTITATSQGLAGDTFNFEVTDNGPTAPTATTYVSVTAGDAGTTNCTIAGNFPLGEKVSVVEIGDTAGANYTLTGVSVSPASQNDGSTSTTANLIVGTGINEATFTNQAMGYLELCKIDTDGSTYPTFDFVVTDSTGAVTDVSVQAGQCSHALDIAAGTATVDELQNVANFHLDKVVVNGINEHATNPVTVPITEGGVADESLVTYYNAVDPGVFKVCTTTSSAGLSNATYTFTTSQPVQSPSGGTETTFTLGSDNCSLPSKELPVVDPDGNPTNVTITETANQGGSYISTITLAGSGTNFTEDTETGSSSFDIQSGTSIVTYDNESSAG